MVGERKAKPDAARHVLVRGAEILNINTEKQSTSKVILNTYSWLMHMQGLEL